MKFSHDADPVSCLLQERVSSYVPSTSRGLTPGSSIGAARSRAVVVPLFDMTAAAVDRVIGALARRVVVDPTFTPVLFTSLDLFAVVRHHGWVVEHVLAEDDWQRAVGGTDWMTHVQSRFEFVLATYAPTAVVFPDLDGRFRRCLDMEPFDHLGSSDASADDLADIAGWRAWGSVARAGETSTLSVEITGGASVAVTTRRSLLPLTFVEFVDGRSGPEDWSLRARERGWSSVSIESREPTRPRGPSLWAPIRRAVPSVVMLVSHPADIEVPPGYDFALRHGDDVVLSSAYGDVRFDPIKFTRLLRRLEELAAA